MKAECRNIPDLGTLWLRCRCCGVRLFAEFQKRNTLTNHGWSSLTIKKREHSCERERGGGVHRTDNLSPYVAIDEINFKNEPGSTIPKDNSLEEKQIA